MKPAGFITRKQASKKLGVSVTTLLKLEASGKLVLHRTEGRVWYSEDEFEEFAGSYRPKHRRGVQVTRSSTRPHVSGSLAARVYKLLDQRMSHRQIVMAIGCDPDVLVEIYRHYKLGPDGIERERREREELARIERQGKDLARDARRADWMRHQQVMRKHRSEDREQERAFYAAHPHLTPIPMPAPYGGVPPASPTTPTPAPSREPI